MNVPAPTLSLWSYYSELVKARGLAQREEQTPALVVAALKEHNTNSWPGIL